MRASRKVSVRLEPQVVMKYFPYLNPGKAEIDRVEAAFLASVGRLKLDPSNMLKDDRDTKAFLVLHSLARKGRFFRIDRPYVKVLMGDKRKRILPVWADEELPKDLLNVDFIAVVDLNGDVAYYEIEEAKLKSPLKDSRWA